MTKLYIFVGSQNDMPFMTRGLGLNDLRKTRHELFVASVHREPTQATELIRRAVEDPACKVIIAGAASATGLPGVIAGMVAERLKKILVLGVRFEAHPGMRAIEDMSFGLSMMPEGVPLAYTGYNEKGFLHACMLAARVIGE